MNSDFNASSSNKNSLQELQSFIGEILQSENELSRESFRPLTDGLGLESPKHFTVADDLPIARPIKKLEAEPAKKVEVKPVREPLAPANPSRPSYSGVVIASPVPQIISPTPAVPPPIPSVSLMKRISCVVLDQLFVQTLWAIALVITSNILTGFETGFSAAVFKGFSNPLFFRFAVLEFATLWLGYLAICLGITNMTFGMWVWGIRISYGDKRDENYGLRKIMRIFWSFVFFAPILPSVLLLFRKNQRNLLDALSGSNIYSV